MYTENGWVDVKIFMLGKLVTGARGVKYMSKQEKENIYGLGKKPIGRSRGKQEFEGELTLLGSEIETLQKSLAPGKTLLDIAPFDITVVFEGDSGRLVTDRIIDVEFTEAPKEIKEGDMFQEITLPIIIGDIKYAVI